MLTKRLGTGESLQEAFNGGYNNVRRRSFWNRREATFGELPVLVIYQSGFWPAGYVASAQLKYHSYIFPKFRPRLLARQHLRLDENKYE
jgi:hypothetical protein